jgi:hypothetical protein
LGCWVVPFKNYVRQFHPISKMATTWEHSLTLDTMGNYFKNLLIRNYLDNWNQTRSQWSLCEVNTLNIMKFQPIIIPWSLYIVLFWLNVRNCYLQVMKFQHNIMNWTLWEIISKIFSSETTWPIETKRGHNGPYVAPCKIVSDIMTLHLLVT